MSEDDYEEMAERTIKINDNKIRAFYVYLEKKGLTKKTIEKHCSNIAFYGNDFIINTCEEDEIPTVDMAMFHIDYFLGSWFIRKCMWSSESSIKEYISSFKKFYGWLNDLGAFSKTDYQEFQDLIKQGKEEWLGTMKKYDDPDTDLEDVFGF